jgi:hypothetical protein
LWAEELVTVTKSKEEHDPVVCVHFSVTLVPMGTPVTLVVGDVGDTIVAEPD